jgi:ABC-2 type transport system permease protein
MPLALAVLIVVGLPSLWTVVGIALSRRRWPHTELAANNEVAGFVYAAVGVLYAAVLAFVFIAANLALGLCFSSLARTQQQAMQMSFFFLLPNSLLSGFMFPFEAMPRAAQALAQALPLTHFLRIVRGIVLKGAGLGDLSAELLWLSCILVALVVLASLRFTKKLA